MPVPLLLSLILSCYLDTNVLVKVGDSLALLIDNVGRECCSVLSATLSEEAPAPVPFDVARLECLCQYVAIFGCGQVFLSLILKQDSSSRVAETRTRGQFHLVSIEQEVVELA